MQIIMIFLHAKKIKDICIAINLILIIDNESQVKSQILYMFIGLWVTKLLVCGNKDTGDIKQLHMI